MFLICAQDWTTQKITSQYIIYKKKKKKLYYDYTTVRSEPIQYPRSVEVPSDLLKTLQSLENNL